MQTLKIEGVDFNLEVWKGLSEKAFIKKCGELGVFAEYGPNQKELIATAFVQINGSSDGVSTLSVPEP
jgi:magnesium-transporting ATPase (P-type)